jgi:hypothetical protein
LTREPVNVSVAKSPATLSVLTVPSKVPIVAVDVPAGVCAHPEPT